MSMNIVFGYIDLIYVFIISNILVTSIKYALYISGMLCHFDKHLLLLLGEFIIYNIVYCLPGATVKRR